jgi:hypothetical protein
VEKRWWLMPLLVNVAVLVISAVFLCVNWSHILDSESPLDYSNGMPFCDGRNILSGVIFPVKILLVIFNAIEIIFLSLKKQRSQKFLLIMFASIVLLDIILCVSGHGELIMFLSVALSFYLICFLIQSYIPLVVFLCILLGFLVFLVLRKKRAALPFSFLIITFATTLALGFLQAGLELDL